VSVQADIYRPLRLPVLLVGDGKLGGISGTLAALESLLVRGHEVAGVVLLEDPDGLDNAAAVRSYAAGRLGRASLPVINLRALPERSVPLGLWMEATGEEFKGLIQMLAEHDRARLARMRELRHKASRLFWYPFTQHRDLDPEQVWRWRRLTGLRAGLIHVGWLWVVWACE
jgi:bifunctional dethiobiotin synthetase / adenosylmethionine---8-amino-7-oxononanoate aminotransferase